MKRKIKLKMQTYRYLFFYILFFLLFASVTHARPWIKFLSKDLIPTSNIPDFIYQNISSDLDAYYISDLSSHKIKCVLTLKTGRFLESQKHAGITKLWGSTVEVLGTKDYPRAFLAEYLEGHATKLKIFVHLEYIQISVTAFSHFFWNDFQLVLDAVQNPLWEEDTFRIQKKKHIQRFKRKLENPAYLSRYLSVKYIYRDNIRSDILASSSSIENITLNDLKEWHNKIWSVSKRQIHASGNLQPDDFSDKILLLLKKNQIPQTSDLEMSVSTILSDPFKLGFPSQEVFYYIKNIPQTIMLLVAKSSTNMEKDLFGIKIFNFLLGGDSFNSELVQKIRVENGWAYTVYSHYNMDQYSGLSYIFLQSQNENVSNVTTKLYSILSNPSNIISLHSLKRAKMSIANQYVFLYETLEQLLEQRINLLLSGRLQSYYAEYLPNIKNVSISNLTKISQKYYDINKYAWIVIGPESGVTKMKDALPSSFKFTMLPKISD